jgi:hypothetical protein
MWKRVFTLIAVIGAALLVAAPAAYAEGPEPRGSLSAQGDGIAFLWGRGTVELRGNGVLWILDKGGDAEIEVTGTGQKKEYGDGWIQYAGFHGTASVSGSRIAVVVAGVDIDLQAQGRGRARLWGHGSYQSPAGEGEWKAGLVGARVRLAAPAE